MAGEQGAPRTTTTGAAHPCPACGSGDVARIVYGMPAWDDTWERNLASGEWAVGGCLIWPEMPTWRCNACETAFGSPDGAFPSTTP